MTLTTATRKLGATIGGFALPAALALAFVLALALANPAHAATITVDSLDDVTPVNDGNCTLREAITNANKDDQSGSIDCAAGSGSDVIRVGVTGMLQLDGALPELSSNLQIEGPGADRFTVSRDSEGVYRIFTVTSGSVVSISGITISGGNAPNSTGGGIFNDGGNLTISGSTISGNSAVTGGGIHNSEGILTVSGSTISGNSASFGGGGVFSDTFLSGTQKSTITNSTISGNSSPRGSGVYNFGGLSVIEHSTITNNTAPNGSGNGVASYGQSDTRTEVLSSIISANQGTDVDFTDGTTNSFSSKGYNLIGDGNATGAFNQTGDQIGVSDPKLGALSDNGGPTFTHALLARSSAIDKGKSALTIDQRGELRPFNDPSIAPATGGDNSDIGSFEAQSVLNSAPQAKDDAYSTEEDTALTVDAPGVLINDTDTDKDTLTAVVVDDVDNGTLTLDPDGSFSYTPKANYNGEDSFTYKANDGSAASDVATVSITVGPVNDAPGFTKGADQTVNEDAGAQSVTGWATNISAGPSNESDQQVSFDVTNDNDALFTAGGQPKISPDGTLTYRPAKDANGSATVSVVLKDDGGTANGGANTSAARTFTITVKAVNDAPTVEVAAGGQCGTSGTSGRINLTVGDVESAAGALPLLATSSNQNLVPNSGLSAGGSGANRTLTVNAAAERSGTATITVRASDGQSSGTVPVTVKVGSDLNDTLSGTSGADIIFGRNGANAATGQGGNDLICGGNGPDAMSGGSGNDTLDGANGNDALRGDAGKDILRGSAGDDTLTGGTETDSFDGGSGTDTATDFNATEGDSRRNIP